MRYILNILIAIDQLINTLIGGYPDETLSASAYVGEQQGRFFPKLFRPVIDFLFRPFEKAHCQNSYMAELNRWQSPNPSQPSNI